MYVIVYYVLYILTDGVVICYFSFTTVDTCVSGSYVTWWDNERIY